MYEVILHWASKTRDPWAQTSAHLWVKCKRHQLKGIAENLRDNYGANSVQYNV